MSNSCQDQLWISSLFICRRDFFIWFWTWNDHVITCVHFCFIPFVSTHSTWFQEPSKTCLWNSIRYPSSNGSRWFRTKPAENIVNMILRQCWPKLWYRRFFQGNLVKFNFLQRDSTNSWIIVVSVYFHGVQTVGGKHHNEKTDGFEFHDIVDIVFVITEKTRWVCDWFSGLTDCLNSISEEIKSMTLQSQ